jgi:hypothetical protein
MPVDSCVQVDYSGERPFVYNGVIEDAVAENLSALTPYRYPQDHSFLDLEIPREDFFHFRKTVAGTYLRKKTKTSQIDADDRNGSSFYKTRNTQKGPVSADHHNRFHCIGDIDFLIDAANSRIIDIFFKKNFYVALFEPFFELPGKTGRFRAHAFIDYCDVVHLGPPKN